MSKGLIERSILTDIADAIREKTGNEDPIKPVDMADAILSISGGGGEFIRFDCTGVVGTFTVPKTGTTWRTSTTSSPVIQKGCRFHASLKNNTTTACTYYVDVTANGESWTRLFTKDSSTATDIIAVPLDDYVGHAITVRLGVYNKHQYNDWTWTIDTMYIDNPDELVLFENGVYLNPDIFDGFTNLGINATTKAIYMSFNGTGGNSYLSKKSIDTTRYNTVHMLVDTTYSTGYSIPTWNFVLKYSDSSGAISDYDSFNGAVVGRESVIKVKEGSRVNIEVGYSSKQQIITCSIYKIWLAYDPTYDSSDNSIIPYYFPRMKVNNTWNSASSGVNVQQQLVSNSNNGGTNFTSLEWFDVTDIAAIVCKCNKQSNATNAGKIVIGLTNGTMSASYASNYVTSVTALMYNWPKSEGVVADLRSLSGSYKLGATIDNITGTITEMRLIPNVEINCIDFLDNADYIWDTFANGKTFLSGELRTSITGTTPVSSMYYSHDIIDFSQIKHITLSGLLNMSGAVSGASSTTGNSLYLELVDENNKVIETIFSASDGLYPNFLYDREIDWNYKGRFRIRQYGTNYRYGIAKFSLFRLYTK